MRYRIIWCNAFLTPIISPPFYHSIISFFLSIMYIYDSHTYYRWVRRVRIRGNSTTLPSGSSPTTMCRTRWCKEGRKEGRKEGEKEEADHDVPSSTVSQPSSLTRKEAMQFNAVHTESCNRTASNTSSSSRGIDLLVLFTESCTQTGPTHWISDVPWYAHTLLDCTWCLWFL